MTRARWLPLMVGGGWNSELRKVFAEASGAYALRDASGKVRYVGESHTGRGWKTLLRHFQDPTGKFAVRNEFTVRDASGYSAAVWVTSMGARGKANGDQTALELQAKLIKRYRPSANRDDGTAVDDFAFGANVNPSKPYDAAAVRSELEAWPRDRLLDFCRWNDPNGEWDSADDAELRDQIEQWCAENEETPAEIRRRGRRNPSAPSPVVLGELVSLVYRGRDGRSVKRTFAPGRVIVAVRGASRLVLLFAPKITGSSSSAGRKEYAKTHWGKAGDGKQLTGDVLEGDAPKLGTVLGITYATKKGDDPELVDYWHTFGDYGAVLSLRKRAFIPPALEGATVGGRQLLRLVGGSYTVTEHGIVG